jgi:histone H3/H4
MSEIFISRPAIMRLAKRAGVSRLASDVYEYVQMSMFIRLSDMVMKALNLTSYLGRRV